MSDPSYAIQKALFDQLMASTDIRLLVGDRVYHDVPPPTGGDVRAQKPYITIGEDQILSDQADCMDGAEVILTVHGWAISYPQSKRLSAAINDALDMNYELALVGHRLVEIGVQDIRHLSEPDGISRHAVVTIRALTEKE